MNYIKEILSEKLSKKRSVVVIITICILMFIGIGVMLYINYDDENSKIEILDEIEKEMTTNENTDEKTAENAEGVGGNVTKRR